MIVCLRTVDVPDAEREGYLAWIDENQELRRRHGILAELVLEPSDGAGETVLLTVAEREGGHSYDAKGARYTHRDGLCSFEVLVEEYEIADPAVHLLARIVHGADVSEDRDATPQSPGLQAVAEGFHYLIPDDD